MSSDNFLGATSSTFSIGSGSFGSQKQNQSAQIIPQTNFLDAKFQVCYDSLSKFTTSAKEAISNPQVESIKLLSDTFFASLKSFNQNANDLIDMLEDNHLENEIKIKYSDRKDHDLTVKQVNFLKSSLDEIIKSQN